jgi:hypothetical protein
MANSPTTRGRAMTGTDCNPYEAPSAPPECRPGSINREAMEWLGLTRADLLVYLAVVALFAMLPVTDPAADAALAGTALLATAASCRLGMRRDPTFSAVTNAVKLVFYPTCLATFAAAIVLHYTLWPRLVPFLGGS